MEREHLKPCIYSECVCSVRSVTEHHEDFRLEAEQEESFADSAQVWFFCFFLADLFLQCFP